MDTASILDIKISLRYDGLDAENHEIDLACLGESLKGFSKILATAGNFAVTQRYSKNVAGQDVKVYAKEARANCFTLDAVLNFVGQSQLFSGAVGSILGALIPYIFSRNSQKKEEMKLLKDSLDKAIEALGNKDRATIDGLLAVIDKMAGELRPSVRQAVSPIGNTCREISVTTNCGYDPARIDEEDKAVIDRLNDDEVIGLREYKVFITEFDAQRTTAKVILLDDDSGRRVPAEINDPSVRRAGNPYITALNAYLESQGADSACITVTAKASVKKGNISKLYIADAS
ncbi:TPA: hypothetical protein I8438_001797 [Serratia marcescens]|uniref:Uncharacterized protein n=1 Tax=Serratia marcescens TaxID=615 RepID=A0AB33FZQ6_SERMA|nr:MULTISPECIES: hypothetical protein [Serratia]AKL42416.1 hypothetical protein AB188_18460 [Serratia marcescens]AWL69723.1 hypothetical protein DKC05_19735 [Serratia marcescens]UBI62659.1 hypothetical protein GF111_17545 [Serratia sp. HRI]HAT2209820.1 hypothetical protein [Serratia marcescens]HAT2221081.1 hypothetical protein [Serratia marcescens]